MHLFIRLSTKLMHLSKTTIGIIISGFVLFSASAAYSIEPETFGNWFNAFYWVLTTMATVGYGDYFMESAEGKIFTIFLYIFGIGLLSLVIGKVVDSFAEIQRKRGAGLLNFQGKNHVVIVNWSRKAKSAIEEILCYDPRAHIVLIDDSVRHPLEHMEQVHFVSGDPAADDVLNKASIANCRAAIVFADERIEESALVDGKSLLVVSSIERLAPDVHTTVEITQEQHVPNFRHAHVNEFILSHDAISRLAVRAALQEGSSDVISQLLSRGNGSDLYEVAVDSSWKTYRDAFDALLMQGATLIADRDDLAINRKLDAPLPAEAKLYVVADAETHRKIAGKRS
ncbi:potassium channel protein [Saccharibacillus kuerlensis]|uniref:Potassium channel protein n=1 Tax=Saccharibacillus kuerlensis TaxID=459527 RepID=A0ABQ2KVP9_9BACL|nr:potassium channel family protein [Saccharibacillus kuerlensis]GGN94202.1 potassium channel protein [Saccharibacillus kuerlensis]